MCIVKKGICMVNKTYFIAVFLLAVQLSSAFELSASADSINVPVGITEKVLVSVYSDVSESVVLSIMDEKSWMLLQDSQLTVDAGQTKSTALYLTPKNVPLGQYKVRVIAQAGSEKRMKDIFVLLTEGRGVHLDRIMVTGGLEPKGTVSMKFSVISLDDTEYHDVLLNMTVSSPSGKIAEIKETFSIMPKSTKVFEKSMALKENAQAGSYRIDARLVQSGKALDSLSQGFIVVEKAIIEKEVAPFYSGIGYGKTIKIRNAGNAEQALYTIQQQVSGFEGMFFAGTRPAAIADNTYSWEIKNLKPGSEAVITYRIDYSPLVMVLAVAGVIAWIYLDKFRTIRLRKYIMQKKTIEEGTEFTIGIDIRNAGDRAGGIVVKDFVPSAFRVKDAEGIRPSKKNRESGTELTWKLADMDANEERVVSYRITPVFSVSGQISLPSAIASFSSGKKARESISNEARIGIASREKMQMLNDVFKKK